MSGFSLPAYFASKGQIVDSGNQRRYALYRIWDRTRLRCNFIMLNPSTADDHDDDPTVRRCIDYAFRWGYGSLVITNLFAWRSADPAVLATLSNPVGRDNDWHIREEAERSDIIVCAWGTKGSLHERGAQVRKRVLKGLRLYYLRLTKSGEPGHPLYLPKSANPIRWDLK